MGKTKARKRRVPQEPLSCPPPSSKLRTVPFWRRIQAVPGILLHPQPPDGPYWKFLPWVLGLAFAVRAAVALSGDFALHPDEIMQYLEPAHRLVFGSGVIYWEFFYGGRSWLVPGLVAGFLALLDLLNLGQPVWYVDAVKLMFCAISLLIPAGMYFFARQHFGEIAARVALLTGTFWYELVGFAHKPMTEFIGAALLCILLALCMRMARDKTWVIWLTASLAVLMAAIRLQYAPLALFLMGVTFLQTAHRMQLVFAASAVLLAVGLFDAVTWDAGLFHSYLTNIQLNLVLDPLRADESLGYQFLLWLALASVGLGVLCMLAALFDLRRYGFLFAMIAMVLLLHSLSAHKEYRFVFAVVPLWLLIGSDLAARAAASLSRPQWFAGAMTSMFALVSLAGILNVLPYQDRVYHGYSNYHGTISFFREQDPRFQAYRYLARAPDVKGVLHADRFYYELPGYYYLHRKIPFYDRNTLRVIGETNLLTPSRFASHILSENPKLAVAGYRLDRTFGKVRILRRERGNLKSREWENYQPIDAEAMHSFLVQINPQSPVPPADFGIRYVE